MRTVTSDSVAGAARHRVERARPGTFFRRRDFEGGDRAIESALSRLAAEGELVRVRRGLYWRGKKTRFGMTHPSALEAAIAVGGPGSGPSGVAAAHFLGLTTQVPATVEVAVPGKTPEPMRGVRFRSRPYSRRERRLTPIEVAVLEVLRDPNSAEASWPGVVDRIRELITEGSVRASVLDAEASTEPSGQGAGTLGGGGGLMPDRLVDDPDAIAAVSAAVASGIGIPPSRSRRISGSPRSCAASPGRLTRSAWRSRSDATDITASSSLRNWRGPALSGILGVGWRRIPTRCDAHGEETDRWAS